MRKRLRQFLPTHATLLQVPALRWLAPLLSHPRLWHLHRRSVASGVAIGMVTGLVPAPVQMLLAALIAIPLRANVAAAAFTTLYTNPLTFIPLYLLAYRIGAFVTGNTAPPAIPPEMSWSYAGIHDALPQLLHWMESAGITLLVGLGIQAVLFAAGGYVAIMVAWRITVTLAWRHRAKVRSLRCHPRHKSP